MLAALALWLIGCSITSGLDISNSISLENYDPLHDSMTSCTARGFDFFDGATYQCKNCPSGQVPDFSSRNGLGDAISCKCDTGYKLETLSCSGVSCIATLLLSPLVHLLFLSNWRRCIVRVGRSPRETANRSLAHRVPCKTWLRTLTTLPALTAMARPPAFLQPLMTARVRPQW